MSTVSTNLLWSFTIHMSIRKLSNKIRNISTDKLNIRLDPKLAPVELSELVLSFNEMLENMDDVFQRLSNLSADITHELRSPITNLITQTQVTLNQTRSIDEYREVLESNLEEFERISKMITDMLWLAKSDNGLLRPSFESFDMAKEINEILGFYESWAEGKNVGLKLIGPSTTVFGDKEMLKRAISNLLINAIRHTDTDSTVFIRLDAHPEGTNISVENTGDVIPEEYVSKLFNRFFRIQSQGDEIEADSGIGLGLAIVQSIVKVHGGTVSVDSKDRTTIFCIKLTNREQNHQKNNLIKNYDTAMNNT